jgi:heparan sulfate proteoglycan 2 (perlecan)
LLIYRELHPYYWIFEIRYESGFLSRPNDDPDVQISGNGFKINYKADKPLMSGVTNFLSIPLYENHWLSSDGQRVSREKFMSVLASINSMLLKATHSYDVIAVSLLGVTLDIAVDKPSRGVGSSQEASSVEICRCPIGYQVLSINSNVL